MKDVRSRITAARSDEELDTDMNATIVSSLSAFLRDASPHTVAVREKLGTVGAWTPTNWRHTR